MFNFEWEFELELISFFANNNIHEILQTNSWYYITFKYYTMQYLEKLRWILEIHGIIKTEIKFVCFE